MRRDAYHQLQAWKQSPHRKPLVVNGARQVGKTFLLKLFSKEFQRSVYFNLEEQKQISSFFTLDLNPTRILQELETYSNTPLQDGETLIIFDEIQVCGPAVTSLKYFQEKYPNVPVIAAGSLLGVKLKRDGISFPVGKVDFLDLYPLSFFEYLEAVGYAGLRARLETEKIEILPSGVHDELVQHLRNYFVMGGMPAVIAHYREHRNLLDVRKIQNTILTSYTLDFAKYAPPETVMKLMTLWESIPGQLAKENKKFIFSTIRKSARGREFMDGLQWLKDAGLIYFCRHVETPRLPLMSYTHANHFKVYLLDVGLLGALSQLSEKTILEGNVLFTEFKGALTENFVATQLVKPYGRDALYYWTSEGTAEVDFILSYENAIYPLEVKAGSTGHLRSLHSYHQQYSPVMRTRTSLQPLQIRDQFANYPLYLVERFPLIQPE